MKEKQGRLLVYAKDLQRLTHYKERNCRYLMEKIRAHFNKPKKGAVTIHELAEFMGLELALLKEAIY